MRLNKYIADSGLCSRRKADELIQEGKVKVNGLEVKEFGMQIEADALVEVNGKVIRPSTGERIYIMLNKPTGFITSVQDDRGRRTVFDLIDDMDERLFPVGRLDYNSSGLLILTNDGEFSNLMMHPKNKIYKTYLVRVKGMMTNYKANILRKGVIIDGKKTAPAMVDIIKQTDKSSLLEIKIHEGRNRQIRKMCEALGNPVIDLHRMAIGDLTLGHLKIGHYKKINPSDIQALINKATK